jgi:hypothetical protein
VRSSFERQRLTVQSEFSTLSRLIVDFYLHHFAGDSIVNFFAQIAANVSSNINWSLFRNPGNFNSTWFEFWGRLHAQQRTLQAFLEPLTVNPLLERYYAPCSIVFNNEAVLHIAGMIHNFATFYTKKDEEIAADSPISFFSDSIRWIESKIALNSPILKK